MDIYSRSFGSIESEPKERNVSVPPDYNGSLYRDPPPLVRPTPSAVSAAEKPNVEKEINQEEKRQETAPLQETEKNTGVFRSILEKISAEDLVLFILILSVLLSDADENGTVLAVILAILLT